MSQFIFGWLGESRAAIDFMADRTVWYGTAKKRLLPCWLINLSSCVEWNWVVRISIKDYATVIRIYSIFHSESESDNKNSTCRVLKANVHTLKGWKSFHDNTKSAHFQGPAINLYCIWAIFALPITRISPRRICALPPFAWWRHRRRSGCPSGQRVSVWGSDAPRWPCRTREKNYCMTSFKDRLIL